MFQKSDPLTLQSLTPKCKKKLVGPQTHRVHGSISEFLQLFIRTISFIIKDVTLFPLGVPYRHFGRLKPATITLGGRSFNYVMNDIFSEMIHKHNDLKDELVEEVKLLRFHSNYGLELV